MYTNKTIDLCPYLPAPTHRRNRHTVRNIVQLVGMVIEGVVTLGIGLGVLAGIYVFLTIL